MSSPLIPEGITYWRNEYASIVVAFVTYGMYVTLAGICMYILLQYRRQTQGQYVMIAYTCAMFISTTVYIGGVIKLCEISLIETVFNPAAFVSVSSRVSMTKNTAYVINVWLADSLVVYRTYIILGGNLSVMVLPFIILIATIGTSTALLIETGKPGASFARGSFLANMGTAFLSLSVSSNILSTLLIAAQLLRHQRALRQAGLQKSDLYARIFTVIAESAALYSGCGLIYIPLYSRDSSAQYAVSALYTSLGSITPALIIIRMALGIAANDSCPATISTLAARVPDSNISEKQESLQINTTRSHDKSTVATSTLTPKYQGWKSAQTLGDASSDVYAMEHSKRAEIV